MRNITTRIITTAVLALGLLVSGFTANAASIYMTPSAQFVADNASFSVDIWASALPAYTTGGALDITWDANAMTLNSLYIATTDPNDSNGQFTGAWDPVSSGFSGTDLISPGMIEGLYVGSFNGVAGDQPIARLNFTLGTGVTNAAIGLAEAAFLGTWGAYDPTTGTPYTLTNTYTGATVNPAAIPAPAAVWLFGSGLLGLAGVARRRG